MIGRLTPLQGRLLLLVLCAPLLGLLGVIAAEAVPDSRIADHLLDAERAGILTRERGLREQKRSTTPLDTVVQNPTECLAFSVGLGDQPGRNHVTTAIVSPVYNRNRAYIVCGRLGVVLDEYEATGQLEPGTTYLRYWHGYAVITRPGIGLFGLAGTRWIAFVLAAAAIGAMGFAIARAFGRAAAAILIGPVLLTTDTIIGGLSTTVAISTASAWAGGWMTFALVSRRPDWKTAGVVAALAGVVSAYLDLMTTMPGAFALTVISAALGVLAANGVAARGKAWRVSAAAAVGWIIGLVWMWGSKWVIAAIVVGVDKVVDTVRSQIDFRLSGQRVDPSWAGGLTETLSTWWDKPLTPWVVFAVAAMVAVVAVYGRRRGHVMVGTGLCVAITVVPVVAWYLALNQHSQNHQWLLYRSHPIAFGAIGALVYAAMRPPLGPPVDAPGSSSAAEATAGSTFEAALTKTPQSPGQSVDRARLGASPSRPR
jgi:hypothetical protein